VNFATTGDPNASMKNRKREIRTSGSVRDEDGQHPHLLGHRRQFLHLAAGAAALPTVSRIAWSQAYPTRPVRVVVGFAAGGPTDIVARLMGQWLSERSGQQFVIENRPGAGSNIATEVVVRAPPDGYTLLIFDASPAINATLYDKLSFNFIHDIAPVASIVRLPFVILLNPSVPARTNVDFIAYAKSNPSKVNMASAGIGSPPHISGELFKMMTVLSGQVQFYITTLAQSIGYIRSGKLRALAVAAETRLDALPEIPTVSESVPGYEASGWWCVGAPKNTPAEILETLNKEVNSFLADPNIKARLADLGGTELVLSPSDFGKLIADETEKWAKVIRAANIKAE
jgi:tripartite-type tricarboxylate transporter receptor subunit TctC